MALNEVASMTPRAVELPSSPGADIEDSGDCKTSGSESDTEDEEANMRSFVSMRLAEVLRDDISPVACLSCNDEGRDRNRAACPCFATLHPFCDLFHTWLCHRLIDDGAGTCCLLPTQVIADPNNPAESELEAAERDAELLVSKPRSPPRGGHDDDAADGGDEAEEDDEVVSADNVTSAAAARAAAEAALASAKAAALATSERKAAAAEGLEAAERNLEAAAKAVTEQALAAKMEAARKAAERALVGELDPDPVAAAAEADEDDDDDDDNDDDDDDGGGLSVTSSMCDATRFHTDTEDASTDDDAADAGDAASETGDGMRSGAASEAEEADTDPLTMQLRVLAVTASEMVHSLEKNVGDLRSQKTELSGMLALCLELTEDGLPLALEEILEWYSVLSILACSFPTQRELHEQRKKAEREATTAEVVAQAAEAEADAAETAAAARKLRSAADLSSSDRKASTASKAACEAAAVEAEEKAEAAAEAFTHKEKLMEQDAKRVGGEKAGEKRAGTKAAADGEPKVEEDDDDEASDGGSEVSGVADEGDESSAIINESLNLPPLLLRSTDRWQPLRPVFLGAASEKDAGQWFMGLQGLRESPARSIEQLCVRRWRTWQQSHSKYLIKSVKALRNCRARRPTRLLHEWLAVNDYCDWVQQVHPCPSRASLESLLERQPPPIAHPASGPFRPLNLHSSPRLLHPF